jgi:hypothetical protein
MKKQRDAGVSEAVLDLMGNILQREAEEGEAEDGGEVQVYACMCCYYWLERRRTMPIIPLPMQNLLWFLKTLRWCEGTKCDSRILQRLVQTVVKPGNHFAGLFDDCEFRGLRQIAGQLAQRRERAGAQEPQGAASFCVKRALAAIWREQNGDSLFLPHAAAGDLLRAEACVEE